jgi:hypothetical protein
VGKPIRRPGENGAALVPNDLLAMEEADPQQTVQNLARQLRKSVECIISLDDENHTYNRRVNYLSPISEHHMILRALEHNSEDRIATALNVDVGTIRKKRDLLNGVCKEAADLLKDHRVTSAAFAALRG